MGGRGGRGGRGRTKAQKSGRRAIGKGRGKGQVESRDASARPQLALENAPTAESAAANPAPATGGRTLKRKSTANEATELLTARMDFIRDGVIATLGVSFLTLGKRLKVLLTYYINIPE